MSQGGELNVVENNPAIPTSFETDSGTAVAVGNVIKINGTGSTSTSASGNQIIINSTGGGGGGGLTWNVVTSASPTNPIQIVAQNGYICNGVSQVTFILPLAPTVGDTYAIVSNTATFQVTENGAQQIRAGADLSTAGSGTMTSNTVGDNVQFIYVGSNLFLCMPSQGTLTIT